MKIHKTVFVLGVVSLLTDLSSEMIYPLLPVFLTVTLGASALSLGIIEGVAESTASLLKIVSGRLTDSLSRRVPFLVAGYGLAGMVRPLIGFSTGWPFVLAMRFLDRVGKGIRTSPRDALIADVTDARSRGAAFGFHRAMDHTGAILGPLVAAALIGGFGISMRSVFLLAIIPSALVMVVLIAGVREPQQRVAAAPTKIGLSGWNGLQPNLKYLYLAILVFTLGNSTDAFVLLRLSEAGIQPEHIALLWSLHHVVKSVASYFGGAWSDRIGRRPMLISGWLVYSVIYFAFAWSVSSEALIAVFILYGIYFGLVEPVERAWVMDLAPEHLRGTAIGYYHAAVGLAAFPSSLIFGLIWHYFGAPAAFTFGAVLAFAASAMLFRVRAAPSGNIRPEI